MEKIQFSTRIEKEIDIEVDIYEVIDAISNLPNKRKWSYISLVLNSIDLTNEELTNEQKQLVLKFLNDKLNLFK